MQNGNELKLDLSVDSQLDSGAVCEGDAGSSTPLVDSDTDQSDGDGSQSQSSRESLVSATSARISENYTSIPYGIQQRATYEHGKAESDIMGVTYCGRMRQFIILDSKGLTTWKRQIVGNEVTRTLSYPKYEYKLLTYLVYAKKYNCYFALSKDFSVKVMNHEFVETCSVSADMSSVLFLMFNPVRDELITGGVSGVKVWLFHQVTTKLFMEIKPLANFRLTLKYEIPNVGGSWVKRVDLNHHLNHMYCSTDTDLFVYDMQGKLLFTYVRAHTMPITGCCYSLAAKFLVTASVDSEVKVWSLSGGLVHTFRGHSRAVTSLIIHPQNSAIAITSSLDGTVRMWSLEFMDALYSLVVSTDGVLWMGLSDDQLLYLATARSITLWSLNYFFSFWSTAHNAVTSLSLVGSANKTTRVVATSSDSSVRLFARGSHKNMSTVLPPPDISPLQTVLSVCYSREFNVVFLLVNPKQIWVYTTRTDPACRIAIWDVHQLQVMQFLQSSQNSSGADQSLISTMHSSVMMWTDEGFACPIKQSYLLLGLEDGRILFMDPVVKGKQYMEFKASKDAVQEIRHDSIHGSLMTTCRLKEQTLIEIWTLPELAPQFEVHCTPDVTGYARHGACFMTGHESGNVIFYSLLATTHPSGQNKTKVLPACRDADGDRRPEHNAPVIAVDSCSAMGLFCTGSSDGAIKIWQSESLLSEIMLDESLSAVCFLTGVGDLVVGLKQHIFYVDHTKVCPHLTSSETGADTSEAESFVYEDPTVMYEGVGSDPEPINMENYLVPFEIEFTKDFLEGKLELNPLVQKQEEECEEDADYKMAPTEIYHSPCDTPDHLSDIDLLLDSSFDLEKYMEHDQHKGHTWTRNQQRLVKGKRSTVTFTERETEDLGLNDEFTKFDFPTFGNSPGPSPTPSVDSVIEPEKGASPPTVQGNSAFKPVTTLTQWVVPVQQPPVSVLQPASPDTSPIKKVEKPEVQTPSVPPTRIEHHRLSNITIDVKTVMKSGKKAQPVQKDADHTHVKTEALEQNKKSLYKDIRKKKFAVHRELPKRGQKVVDDRWPAPDVGHTAEAVTQESAPVTNGTKPITRGHWEQPVEEAPPANETPREQLGLDTEMPSRPAVVLTMENKTQSYPPPVPASSYEELREDITSKPDVEEHTDITPVKHEQDIVQKDDSNKTAQDDKNSDNKLDSASMITLPAFRSHHLQFEDIAFVFTESETVTVVPEPKTVTPMLQPLAVTPASQAKLVTPGYQSKADPPVSDSKPFVSDSIPSVSEDSLIELKPTLAGRARPERVSGVQAVTKEKSVSIKVVLPTAGEDCQSACGTSRIEVVDGDIRARSRQEVTDDKSMYHRRVEKRLDDVDSRVEKLRPVSSFVDRGSNEDMLRLQLQRPHTAAQYQFSKEDLEMAYNSALRRYQSLPGVPLCPDKLYQNDGVNFTDRWHERAIQRHMLIRMQNELRQYYATQKRHTEQQRHRERQQSLQGHAECGKTAETKVDMSAYVLRQLAQANCMPHPPVQTPGSGEGGQGSRGKVRPHTVNVAVLQRRKYHDRPESDGSLRTEQNSQTPFRLRMSPTPPPPPSKRYSLEIDPHLLDPRNPNAVRPKSSKSIPSKCSRYILVRKAKEKAARPAPSPLEEQLLYERFPALGARLARHHDTVQHTRPLHTIHYSPFTQPLCD